MYSINHNAACGQFAWFGIRGESEIEANRGKPLLVRAFEVAPQWCFSAHLGLFLPPPLPGESAYSLCARIADGSTFGASQVSKVILGHPRGYAQMQALVGLAILERIYSLSAHRFAADEWWLRTHTSYGAAMPFMPADRRAVVEIGRAHV